MIADMNDAAKILVVNPNTTVAVTERFVAAARRVAPDAVFEGVTGAFGAAVVSSEAENVVAGHASLELLAQHWRGYDAVILAISFDTALEAARELLPIPVIGVTEAMLQAAAVHGPLGLVTFGSVSTPLYSRLLARHGFADRVAHIETIAIDGVATYLSPGAADGLVLAAARRLTGGGAAAVVVCGVANIGAAARLQPHLAVPVFDSLVPSVASALAAIRQATPAQTPRRPISTSSNLSVELSALIAGAAFAPTPGLPLHSSEHPRKEPK